MHIETAVPDGSRPVFAPASDPESEQQREITRQRGIDARTDAYAVLKLGDREREAMEWAARRRTGAGLEPLRAFFDESDAMDSAASLSAWLSGPTFREPGLGLIRDAVTVAVARHDQWLAADRFAANAEKAVSRFLEACMAGVVLFCLVYALLH